MIKLGNSAKVIVIVGFALLATALLAPYLGLGGKENFLIYRLIGMQRRELAYIGIALAVAGLFANAIRGFGPRISVPLRKLASHVPAAYYRLLASFRNHQFPLTLEKMRAAMATPWSVARLCQFLHNQAPLCLTIAALLFFFLAMRAMSDVTSNLTEQWTKEVIRQYEWVSSSDQRAAHVLTLAVVAIFAGICFKLAQRGTIDAWHQSVASSWGITTCITVTALGLISYRLILPYSTILPAAAISVLFLVIAITASRVDQRLTNRAMVVSIAIYFLALVVPGMVVHPIPLMVDDPVALAQFDMHLNSTTMSSRAVAAGYGFDYLPYGYGLLMPSVMSVIDRITHDFTIGHQLRFVQYCQLLFCFAALGAYWCYRPRAYLGILAAMLLAGPYWVTGGLGIWHQNQTGLRSLGLPLGMLAMALAGRMAPSRAAWLLGAIGAVAFLINFETAVAVSLGFVIYFVARTRQVPILLFLRMACAGLLTIVTWLIIYRLALGRLPFSSDAIELTSSFKILERFTQGGFGLRLFDAGYGNENYVIVPFALMIFAHAIYVAIQSSTRLGRGPLNQHAAMRLAVTTTLLVWFAYYINAPNWWQLWTHLFLYGFLVIDVLDRRRFAIGYPAMPDNRLTTRLRHMRLAPAHFLFLFILSMMLVHTNRNLVQYTFEFAHPSWLNSHQDRVLVSDVLMPKKTADALLNKASTLKRLYATENGDLIYLSFNSAFMQDLTGIFQRDPYQDLWVRVPGEAAFDRIMTALLNSRPKVILIDASDGPLAVSGARRDYQNRIRAAVGRAYRNSATEEGWQIWIPLDASKS